MHSSSREDASPNVVLVTIDDETLEANGRLSSWSRDLHADTIRNLSDAGARVIVYDLLFADPASGAEGEASDANLGAAIDDAGNVVLAAAGEGPPETIDGVTTYGSIITPTPEIGDGAYLAAADLLVDGDGEVRRLPLGVRDGDGATYPAMSLAAMYLQFGQEPPTTLPLDGDLPLFGRTVPVDSDGSLRVNYTGGQESFQTLSFDDVQQGNFDAAAVENRIVLVGVTATGTDIRPSPLIGSAHGMEIHANALDTLLRARFLRTTPDAVTLALMLAFAAVAAIAVSRLRLLFGLGIVIVLGFVYFGAGNFAFNSGRIVDFVDPPAAMVLSAVAALAVRVLSERAMQRDLHDLFGRYVSPPVAAELAERADKGQLTLGGQRREVTVMFCDIRGFTPLSASMEPEELVALLNTHFDIIVSRIMENGGIVNKFAGDSVMAFWNAPQAQSDHALAACRAAMEAQELLGKLPSSGPPPRWGFGINTGEALAGNVGSGRRQEYTVMGDPVNISARLCGIAPGGEVWIGERTAELIGDAIPSEALPPQQVKGVEEPVPVYRLLFATPTDERDVEAPHEAEVAG